MTPEPDHTPHTLRSDPSTHGQGPDALSAGDPELLLGAIGRLMSVGGAVIQWRGRPSGHSDTSASLESIQWSDASRAILGLVPEADISHRSLLRRLSPTRRRTLLRYLRKSLRTQADFHYSAQMSCDGDMENGGRWIDVSGTTERRSSGGWTMTVVIRDATEQRTRESLLQREVLQRTQMAAMAGIGSWTVNLTTQALTWSDEVFQIYELEPGDPPSLAEALAFFTPEVAARIEQELSRLIATGNRYELVVPMTTAAGNKRWVHAIGDVGSSTDGVPTMLAGTFRDITKERMDESKARAREERYVFAVEGAQDGLWDWDIVTGEMFFSARWKQLIGYEEHEVNGGYSEWEKRIPEEDRETILAAVNACLSGETPHYRAEFQMRHKDGTWRWILGRGTVMSRDKDGQPLRMVGTHTDITEQVKMRHALVAAKESAEQGARVKSEFLATMSHEIRTPLNGILGITQILMDTELDEEQAEYLRVILGSGTALLDILNDVLDLSRTEAGKMTLESLPFDPLQCARSTVVLLGEEAARKGDLSIDIKADSTVPPMILGDPGRLRQVLCNLVGNAVKFTEHGRITVSLTTLGVAATGRHLVISVRDTGIGISPEDAASLFDAFTQADSTTTRRFGGTGLGLSISRELVHLMGGVIGCRPHHRVGSVFWIEIPILLPAVDSVPAALPAARQDDRDDTECEAAAPVRVLVVEDNPINQVVAQKMLERLGCRVSTVVNGQEAVDTTATSAFDIVFMDCQMPVMDGYEATRRIRSRELESSAPHLPIVAMTANATKTDPDRCRAAGMDDFVSKPVLADTLKAALTRGLQVSRVV